MLPEDLLEILLGNVGLEVTDTAVHPVLLQLLQGAGGAGGGQHRQEGYPGDDR